MRVELLDSSYANVNFTNGCKVSIMLGPSLKESLEYNVRWFRRRKVSDDYDEIGRMDIANGRWGAYPFGEIEQWKIEFWHKDKMVCVFDNHLANKPVILVAKTKEGRAGKGVNFEKIKKYCTDKVNEFNCDLRVYFKGSCAIDFSEFNFKPLRMNDKIPDMYYGLEKEF